MTVGNQDSSVPIFLGGNLSNDDKKVLDDKDKEYWDKKLNQIKDKIEQNSNSPEKKNTGSFGLPSAEGFSVVPNNRSRPGQHQTSPNNPLPNKISKFDNTSLEMAKKITEQEVVSTLTMLPDIGQTRVISDIQIPALMRYARDTFKDPTTKRDLVHLLEQFRMGNLKPGLSNRSINTAGLLELRARNGARLYLKVEPEKILVKAVSNKDNQERVIEQLNLNYKKD